MPILGRLTGKHSNFKPRNALDIKEIKQIVEMMKRSDLTEFEIEEKDLKLRICRHSGSAHLHSVAQAIPPHPPYGIPTGAAINPSAPQSMPPSESSAREETDAEDGFRYITSPMVGTFYRAPSPDSEPFIEPGAKVNRESVVCIIEAMKVMNEIQAEESGTVVEVLVENGDPVEYNQPLFKLKAN